MTNALLSGYRNDVLPRASDVDASEINVPLDRYSKNAATKTLVRNEFVHMSFHLQNWLGGIRSASAAWGT